VAGIRTPQPISEWKRHAQVTAHFARSPAIWEKHYRDVQIRVRCRKEVYMLQTRNGKRTGAGAVRIRWTWLTKAY